eukprot:1786379-Prorocentrum_lima.AAC.1
MGHVLYGRRVLVPIMVVAFHSPRRHLQLRKPSGQPAQMCEHQQVRPNSELSAVSPECRPQL